MEYPSKNDIFLKFKALYDEKNEFVDYVLIETSENFPNVMNFKSNSAIGKRISDIVINDQMNILGLKDLYYHMIPSTRRRFEIYIEVLERWYLVNVFSDEKDYLLMFYTDISRYKKNVKKPQAKRLKDYEENKIQSM